MILLRQDCLVFRTDDGQSIPCSVTEITVELLGEAAHTLDSELLQHAAEAVLHYFKTEQGKQTVSIAEFSNALEKVFRGLGLAVASTKAEPHLPSQSQTSPPRVIEADLRQLAGDSEFAGELVFFPRLREAVRRELDGSPTVFRFRGLRDCVKLLTGAKRWSSHCQTLNDQIVEYLRGCVGAEETGRRCALVVC